jgi:putative FmdB family regulatory protein
MPFYEYECKNCGHTLEAMQKVSESPLKKCPHCGKPHLQRLMSAPVFRLKGGGWYETDFKSEQDSKRNLADRPESQAPKEETKEAPAAASKDAAAADAPKPAAEKGADKPSEKAAPAEVAKKPTGAAPSRRGAASASNKGHAKRPVRTAVKRSAAKPARRR